MNNRVQVFAPRCPALWRWLNLVAPFGSIKAKTTIGSNASMTTARGSASARPTIPVPMHKRFPANDPVSGDRHGGARFGGRVFSAIFRLSQPLLGYRVGVG
jgi:hypothetical protein